MCDWTTSTEELRTFLSDGATERLRYRKRCLGRTNGTNTKFQTLEFRRISDLSSGSAPIGVYVNDSPVSVSGDDPTVGEFTLAAAPANGAEVRATYYYHWFEDTEISTFLDHAKEWVSPGSDLTQVDPGLRPAVIHYAASEAYSKLAIRWSESWSQVYKLEDAKPSAEDASNIKKDYVSAAQDMLARAETLRKQFYSRQDQNEQPIVAFVSGAVRDPVPKR